MLPPCCSQCTGNTYTSPCFHLICWTTAGKAHGLLLSAAVIWLLPCLLYVFFFSLPHGVLLNLSVLYCMSVHLSVCLSFPLPSLSSSTSDFLIPRSIPPQVRSFQCCSVFTNVCLYSLNSPLCTWVLLLCYEKKEKSSKKLYKSLKQIVKARLAYFVLCLLSYNTCIN